jgi:small subunit ribosomal protein S2
MKELLEAGVHFGHYTRRWNPKMRRYIFTERNGIHILDLALTVNALDRACKAVSDTAAQGGTVLMVGTKKQATDTIRTAAERTGMPYVTYRWLGGMLTNWRTMRQRVNHLLELEGRRDRGEFAMLPKKEALLLEREINKLNMRLGGIKGMTELPSMLYIVDTRREEIAVKEANKLKIPIVAMVDTNCDPDPIDYVIPSNDDAIRALKLITDKVADSIEQGQLLRQSAFVEEVIGEQAEAVDTTQRVFDPFDDEGDEDTEPEEELSEADAAKLEAEMQAAADNAESADGQDSEEATGDDEADESSDDDSPTEDEGEPPEAESSDEDTEE